jgi:AraC-like DNA-binding protein
MGYFDDFQILNVTRKKMYGQSRPPQIMTQVHYLGLMQGCVLLGKDQHREQHPFVYLTPKGILTPEGWSSPKGMYRDNFYIECTGERADRFFAAFGAEVSCRCIPVRNAEPFEVLLSEIYSLFTAGGKPGNKRRSVLCLEEFASLLEQEKNAAQFPGGNKSSLMEDLMDRISFDPGKKWNFQLEAQKEGITLRHWNRLFTATSGGMAPHRFLAQCRLRRARELLSSGPLTIKEIAALAGFEGASEFSRFFKKMCGMTPGEFRKSRLH